MDQEKILQQLKDKLLPSVQNLEKEQATDHDFFPALLWALLEKSTDTESLLKNIVLNHSEEIKNVVNTIIQNAQESRIIHEVQIDKAVSFISSKDQESEIKFEQFSDVQFKKITATIIEENNASQKTHELIENKLLAINQKIEDIKNTQSKTKNKYSIWFLVFSIFQIISLIILAIILTR